jgi:rubrerythrin
VTRDKKKIEILEKKLELITKHQSVLLDKIDTLVSMIKNNQIVQCSMCAENMLRLKPDHEHPMERWECPMCGEIQYDQDQHLENNS